MLRRETKNKKVILITGCSSGFGLLTAKKLSQDHIVYAGVRSEEGHQHLKAFQNSHLHIVHLDVLSLLDIKKTIQNIKEKEGKLDVLINNAGYALMGFFENLTEDEIKKQFDTNFFALQAVTREALPLLRQSQDHPKIINISSIAGLTGTPCLGAYNASKWAVEGFSESLYFELLPFGIHVILIEPGAFKTKIFFENKKIGKDFLNPKMPTFKFSQTLMSKMDDVTQAIKNDPDQVALLIQKIMHKKNPKLRYLIGRDAQIRFWLKWALPFSVYAKLLIKKFTKLLNEVKK